MKFRTNSPIYLGLNRKFSIFMRTYKSYGIFYSNEYINRYEI